MTYGRGEGEGVMYFVRFLNIKFHSFWGTQPPPRQDPPIFQLYNVRLSEPLGDIGNKICHILVKQKSFSSNVAFLF